MKPKTNPKEFKNAVCIGSKVYYVGKVYEETLPDGRKQKFIVNNKHEKVGLSEHWAKVCETKLDPNCGYATEAGRKRVERKIERLKARENREIADEALRFLATTLNLCEQCAQAARRNAEIAVRTISERIAAQIGGMGDEAYERENDALVRANATLAHAHRTLDAILALK